MTVSFPPGRRARAGRRAVAAAAPVLSLLLAACTALPPPQRWTRRGPGVAADPVPFRARRDASGPGPVEELSWRRALEICARRNPGVEAARRRLEQAQALVAEARALAWPTLDARGSWVRFIEAATFRGRTGSDVEDETTRTRFFTGSGSDIYSAGFDVSYPLFDGGRNWFRREAAGAARQASREELDRTLADLRLAVAETFLEAVLSAEEIRIAEESLRFAKGEESRARVRAEAGEGLQIDALRFATRASEERLALNRARARHEVLIAALGELLGQRLDPGVELVEPEGELDVPHDGLLEVALEERPELRSLRSQRAEVLHRLGGEKAEYWPTANVFGSYGVLTIDSVKLSDRVDELQAGVSLSMNLFQGGATLARVAALRAQAAELRSRERELALRVEREVREASIDLDVARENVRVSEETLRLAEEVLEQVTQRYRVGEEEVIDVTEAELQRRRSQLSLLRSRTDLLLFQARLRHAAGLGLDVSLEPPGPDAAGRGPGPSAPRAGDATRPEGTAGEGEEPAER